MSQTITLTKARNELLKLTDKLYKHPEEGEIILTKHGKPVATLISAELFESIMETLEIISNPNDFLLLKKSIAEAKNRKLKRWDKIKKDVE